MEIKTVDTFDRHCGGCQLCCKLLPMTPGDFEREQRCKSAMIEHGMLTLREAVSMIAPFVKPAGERCPHQRHHKGCAIYKTRPYSCRMWNCRWLTGDDTADLPRPDRCGYVLDLIPDFVRIRDDETGAITNVQVVQIWVDRPDAHRDPALRRYLLRRAKENIMGLVRFDHARGLVLVPPALSHDGQWHEVTSGMLEAQHSLAEISTALDGPI